LRPTTENRAAGVGIEQVSKVFGKTRVLNSVNLQIEPEEFFTIIGPSGCGKTTLLRIISGFYEPDGGKVYFNKQDVTSLPPWERNIGFVFQNYALWPNMSIFENVAYGLRIRKKPLDYIKQKVKWALDIVDLPGVEDKNPSQLSGGMQQRVAIARAIVIDPDLLLLDEPLSNLDAKLRISLRKHIREIQRNLGITAVYVTHDQEEALEISDRIAIMNKGDLQQVGTPKEVYEQPANHFVANFMGEANFLTGEVTGDGMFVVPSAQVKVPLSVLQANGTVTPGKATMMVRPEMIRAAEEGEHHASGRIVRRYYVGNLKKYVIELADKTTLSWEMFEDPYQEGDQVSLKFAAMCQIKDGVKND